MRRTRRRKRKGKRRREMGSNRRRNEVRLRKGSKGVTCCDCQTQSSDWMDDDDLSVLQPINYDPEDHRRCIT